MTYEQLVLNRHVLEQLKEGKQPSVSNKEKVSLDYLANHYDNIISRLEKEMERRPNQTEFTFQLRVSRK